MNLKLIISFFIILHLRKFFKTAITMPVWNKRLLSIMYTLIALQIVYMSFSTLNPVIEVLSYVMVFGIIGIIYLEEVFNEARATIFAVLPLILIEFVGDFVELITTKSFFNNWDNVFEVGKVFALIWMGTMLIINSRQRKALAKERLKTYEEEKQNKIMASLKAELELQVAERTATLTLQTEELQHALNELKSTQSQLIHSEKMASLGELTAGIAHEIQNPLNFVTNFSEVNTELIAEMKVEIQNGNMEEVIALANDIESNEQKINHHGKRADAIVKGMLQHSRTSSGQKEATDINVLADEYLRLAYHGLRAKDKTFNATMKTDYDETIGTVNIIPQDMGRVILNLITNAFYVVNDKKLIQLNGYEPTVTVSTLKNGNMVEVKVADNGNGIPAKVLDKIFQPFFTTKPTGQGTGLGLSLSYDIVKAHGGLLNVHTKEGFGTEFIIQIPV